MYNNKLTLFQKSSVSEKQSSIWTDEYISESMLQAHLDESIDGASRKSSERTELINHINAKIKARSNILDLGCGPGLYAYELGKLGHTVTGIDFNKRSIEYAQKNTLIKGTIEYQYANYLEDEISGTYNLVMMIYCDFGALIPDEQKILLRKVRDVLSDDRIFMFDVYSKAEMQKIESYRTWSLSEGKDFWSDKPYFLMEEKKVFELECSCGTRYYVIDQAGGKISEYIIWDQYYDEHSLNALMQDNGFELIEVERKIAGCGENTLLATVRKKKS